MTAGLAKLETLGGGGGAALDPRQVVMLQRRRRRRLRRKRRRKIWISTSSGSAFRGQRWHPGRGGAVAVGRVRGSAWPLKNGSSSSHFSPVCFLRDADVLLP